MKAEVVYYLAIGYFLGICTVYVVGRFIPDPTEDPALLIVALFSSALAGTMRRKIMIAKGDSKSRTGR